ncbi:hypothetical protein ACWD4G_37320 [Streptomyces sp. NPDC002643]
MPLGTHTTTEDAMAGLFRDWTGPARGRPSPVYGVFDALDDTARGLADLAPGAGLRRLPVAEPRRPVSDKAALYARLDALGTAVPAFMTGSWSVPYLERVTAVLGPQPMLRPTPGAGPRGGFRCRADLSTQLYEHMTAPRRGHSGCIVVSPPADPRVRDALRSPTAPPSTGCPSRRGCSTAYCVPNRGCARTPCTSWMSP